MPIGPGGSRGRPGRAATPALCAAPRCDGTSGGLRRRGATGGWPDVRRAVVPAGHPHVGRPIAPHRQHAHRHEEQKRQGRDECVEAATHQCQYTASASAAVLLIRETAGSRHQRNGRTPSTIATNHVGRRTSPSVVVAVDAQRCRRQRRQLRCPPPRYLCRGLSAHRIISPADVQDTPGNDDAAELDPHARRRRLVGVVRPAAYHVRCRPTPIADDGGEQQERHGGGEGEEGVTAEHGATV
jgi:hypothetical protein